MLLLMWIVLVLIFYQQQQKIVETEKNPGWLWKERNWTEECLGLPQSPSLAEQPDINIDMTENFNSRYNIELNSAPWLD